MERLIEEVLKIEYPEGAAADPGAGRFDRRYRARSPRRWWSATGRMGYPIEYHHRTNRHGFKAGALQAGLETATGEFVAMFDADFCPPADFLTAHRPLLRRSEGRRGADALELPEPRLQLPHRSGGHAARRALHPGARGASRAGYFFNFNGTAGILRKSMIDDAGGWQHDTLTEDSDLSYRAQLKGWRFVYLPGLDCPSELPVEMHGFQVQQSRWAKGLTQVAKKLLPAILQGGHPEARQGGSVPAPDAQHLLSADDRGFGADAAGDDRALLHGRVADGVYRPAADRGVVLVDLAVLRGRAARVVSEDTGSARSCCCRC